MSDRIMVLSIIFGIVLISSAVGMFAGARRKMNLEQWTVAGRGLGMVLVWLLMAGEIYTTFAFLGASGWAYSKGAPTLYIIAYLTLAYVVSFYILPSIWEVGKKYGMQTQSDFFRQRYGSRKLAALVSLIGVVFMIPYLQLQLIGLGIIVEVCSFNGIDRNLAILIAFALVAAFVFTNGIRAVARISIIKDFLMLFAVFFIGIGLPYMYFDGIGGMFRTLAEAKPIHLTLPGSTTNMGYSWFISTVLLSGFGLYMWPHAFSASFTARSGNTLRTNAVVMPLYGITMPLIFIVGFTAILVVPGLANGDMALLTIVRKSYPAWFLGIIGGAGALTAMVPAAIIILAAATLLAKNVFRELIAPGMTDDQTARLAKALVVVITLIALFFAIFYPTTLVNLLLLGYMGVAQFLPGVLMGLYWDRANKAGIITGLLGGIAVVAFLVLNKMDPFLGINAGFMALCVNFALSVAVSLATPAEISGFTKEPVQTAPTQTDGH